MANYQHLWYLKNRESVMARVRVQQERTVVENRIRVGDFLSNHPCVDCGERDPIVLDFDHLRDKLWDISFMVSRGFAWSTIELEIAKCEVRCANCHARKTAREHGIYDRKHAFLRLGEELAPYDITGQRTCPRCGLGKLPEEFGIACRETGEPQAWCRACMVDYKRGWYLRNREQHMARVRMNHDRTTRENQDRAWEYLGQHPCVDCGEPDPVVLQFDHLRDKKWNVSYMLRGGFRWAAIQAEIDKCEVRCANCHRRKTARDREALLRTCTDVNISEPTAPYVWAIIEATRAVSSVDRAATF
jgi:5-methylcytosine-specific restriction endonuclease McrA